MAIIIALIILCTIVLIIFNVSALNIFYKDLKSIMGVGIDKDILTPPFIDIIGKINYQVALSVISQLKGLEKDDQVSRIYIILDSYGGSAIAGLAISLTMRKINKPITIYALNACSAASSILAAGDPGQRYIHQKGRVLIHRTDYYTRKSTILGELTKIINRSCTFVLLKELDNIEAHLLAVHCHKSLKKICRDTKKGTSFNATEAIAYGFADDIWYVSNIFVN